MIILTILILSAQIFINNTIIMHACSALYIIINSACVALLSLPLKVLFLITYDYCDDSICYLMQSSAEALAGAVLAEVPKQLTEYMKSKGIKPLGK